MCKIMLAVALALTLGGCALTKTFDNPATPLDMYRVKNTYAATLTLAVKWRDYCYARPYAVLMADPIAKPLCQNRREVVRQIQAYRPKVAGSIVIADTFIRDNPQLSATSVIGAAWSAVTAFQALIPQSQ